MYGVWVSDIILRNDYQNFYGKQLNGEKNKSNLFSKINFMKNYL